MAKDRGNTMKILGVAGGCLGLGLFSGCCVLGWALWPAGPPELEVVSAEIVVLPPDPSAPPPPPGAGPRAPQEALRVSYRTEPGADVRLELFRDTADDRGEGTIDMPLSNEDRGRTITAELMAREDYGSPETRVSVSAERAAALVPINRGFRCSFGGCLISHDHRGRISMTPPEGGTIQLGSSRERPPVIDDDILRGVNPSQVYSTSDFTFTLPVRVRFDDGTELTEQFPVPRTAAARAISERLGGVRNGPVRVPAEGSGNAILWIKSRGANVLMGEPQRVGDIGRVAVDGVDSERRQCGTYSGGASGRRRLFVRRQNRVVRLYDRRTGRELASQRLRADPISCPRTVNVRPGRGDIFWSETTVPDATVAAWIRARM